MECNIEKIKNDIKEKLPQLNPEIKYDISEVKRMITECTDAVLDDYREQGYISSNYSVNVDYDRDNETMFVDITYENKQLIYYVKDCYT